FPYTFFEPSLQGMINGGATVGDKPLIPFLRNSTTDRNGELWEQGGQGTGCVARVWRICISYRQSIRIEGAGAGVTSD
ncbi:MAG: hypothetical protein AAF722_12725, partial [Cyanobacteria bacterium P01_C01_bin.70]